MSRRDSRETGALVYGGVPRAHLMPPEVALQKKERGRRRGLITAVIAVVAITVAGVVGSFLVAANAEAQLAEERRTTEQLLAQQLDYTEVTLVRAQLLSITEVRDQLGTLEVSWREELGPYLSVLSSDETIDSLSFAANSPAEPPLGLTGPLRSPRVATVTIVVLSAALPQPQNWYRAWESIDTFADASINVVTLSQRGYETTVTINLNERALAQGVADEGADE